MTQDDELRHREIARRKALWVLASLKPGDPRAVDVLNVLDDVELREANTPQDDAQGAMSTEPKARLKAEYREELESYNDSEEPRALVQQMDLLERRLRLKALRAKRLELYSVHRQHLVGDEVVSKVLGALDMSEANLGH